MKNPFAILLTSKVTQNRLTDIETSEVSLVDKGANRRKFAVIKRELEANNKMSGTVNKTDDKGAENAPADEKASSLLEGLTDGLEKLASLTELVKSHVEKSEVSNEETLAKWQTAMTELAAWAQTVTKTHFVTKAEGEPGPNGTSTNGETGMDSEVAAQAPGGSAGAVDGGETGKPGKNGTSTNGETEFEPEVKAQAPSGEILGEAAADAPKASNGMRAEVEEQTLGHAVLTKSAAQVLTEVQSSVLDLASTVPSIDTVKKTLEKMDGLFISGGLYVDAYDVEALAAVCNAICEAMYDPNEEDEIAAMKKSADKILAEISKRTVAVTKRVTKAGKTDAADGKELKIAALMLKALENGLSNKKEETTMDAAATQKLIDKAVEKAVAAAVAPLNKQITEVNSQVTVLKAEKAELNKKLTNVLAETQTRGSSAETINKQETISDADLFPMDYNATPFRELNKE